MYQNDFLLSFDKLKYDFIVIALKPSWNKPTLFYTASLKLLVFEKGHLCLFISESEHLLHEPACSQARGRVILRGLGSGFC